MLRMALKVAACVLVCVLCAPNHPAAQETGAGKKADLAQMPLEHVQIEAQGVAELFTRLSFAYDIPVGVEVAQNDDELDTYRLDFKKGTLSELLTQFAAEHKQYVWEIEDGVVSVFPKDSHRDPLLRELLVTRISDFSVKEKTSCVSFAESVLSIPEVRKMLGGYGLTYDTGYLGGFYLQQLGQRFSLHVSNMQLKAILDKVVKESPIAKTWVIKRDGAMQTLSLRVKARPEDPPKTSSESNAARVINR